MLIALLLIGALAWWLHKRGELVANIARLAGTAALGLAALQLFRAGKPAVAAAVAAGAALWWAAQRRRLGAARDVTDARALLGVPADADADAIHAAWRRRMTTAHPDHGGDAAAVQAATAARDLLLARLDG